MGMIDAETIRHLVDQVNGADYRETGYTSNCTTEWLGQQGGSVE
jgi:hypothetical protein